MKTMSKEESMLSDLEMVVKTLDRHINFFYENGDKNLSAYTDSGLGIANKVYDVVNFIEEQIEQNNPDYKSIYK